MLIINQPTVEIEQTYCMLSAVIECKEIKTKLWFKADKNQIDYLCFEQADSFVVALLIYAIINEQDIISKAPISEKLYYNLTHYLIPALAKMYDKKPILITCSTTSGTIKKGESVGTSISCGVDSLYTLYEHEHCNNNKVSCLTLFNMGSHGDFGGTKARELYEKRLKRGKQFAAEYGFEILEVDSNISEFLKQNFVMTHTYRNCAVVLAFQKKFKTYYYSSGYSIFDFDMRKDEPAYYDTFLLNMISTENTQFYSSGCILKRIEKLSAITNFEPSFKYLNVCVIDDKNCSWCEKCTRTILALEAIGKLDLYRDVFDLNIYKKKRSKKIGKLLLKQYTGSIFYSEIYAVWRANKIKMPLLSWFYGINYYLEYQIRRIRDHIYLSLK